MNECDPENAESITDAVHRLAEPLHRSGVNDANVPANRRVVILLSDNDPIDFPVSDSAAEDEFFCALMHCQMDETMNPRFQSAIADLVGEQMFITPSKIVSAFCFNEETRP
jgi:hypothetical protein